MFFSHATTTRAHGARRSAFSAPARSLALLGAVVSLGAALHPAHAQKAAPNDQLPPVVRWGERYPLYGVNNDPNDIMRQHVSVEDQGDGDKYLLALARAGNINLIAQVPDAALPVPRAQPEVSPILRMRLAEVDRDCGLTWHRLSERTFLMWPHPDEEKLGRSWSDLYARQQKENAQNYLVEATPENIGAALQKLALEDTPENRAQMTRDYEAQEKQRAGRRLSAVLLKYLREAGKQPGDSQSIRWSELSPEARASVQEMLNIDLQSRWSNPHALWFYPDRLAAFWRSARLSVRPTPDGLRRVYLDGVDEQQQQQHFSISAYDFQDVAPDKPGRAPAAVPRPNKGISIEGSRLPLQQVLVRAQKQSGLSFEAGLERLSKARLTLSVQGMSTTEFLQALSRTFLIEWQITGKKAVARDTSYSQADRYYLSLADLYQYRGLSRLARDDWREENELGRALYEEAGENLFKEGGVPIAQLSQDAQDGVRREGQEAALNILLQLADDFVPAALEDSTLQIAQAEAPRLYPGTLRRLPISTNPLAGAMPLQESYPAGIAVGLARPGHQTYLLAGLSEASQQEVEADKQDAVDRMLTDYSRAQAIRTEEHKQRTQEFMASLQAKKPGADVAPGAPGEQR